MRLCRILRRVRRSDTKRDQPVLGLLAQAVEQIYSMVVSGNHRSVERDRTLSVTSPTTNRSEGASIADGSHRELVLDGTVSKTIDAVGSHLPDLLSDVVSPGHDNVGTQIPNQLFVGTRRVSDDTKPVRLRELHDVAPVASRGTGDGHGLARLQSERTGRATDVP